jgi:hypothetical protein
MGRDTPHAGGAAGFFDHARGRVEAAMHEEFTNLDENNRSTQ